MTGGGGPLLLLLAVEAVELLLLELWMSAWGRLYPPEPELPMLCADDAETCSSSSE